MKVNQATHSVGMMCRLLDISRSGYYAWVDRPMCQRRRTDLMLTSQIAAIHRRSREAYGSPSIHAFEKQRSSMGVFSFAGTPRDILMWSHYAQDHTGVCLRFSAAAHLRVFVGAVGVTYSQSYPKLNWLDMAGGTVKALLSKASH